MNNIKSYIGLKEVNARPMTASEALKNGYRTNKYEGGSDGYEVEYKDGYKSWSPKSAFEDAYKNSNMNFGIALEYLKRGKKVTRKGWNGKGMFLWLKPAATIKAEWCKDSELKALVEANGGEIEALGTICMKTADNKILTGWLASQSDMLSEDWEEYVPFEVIDSEFPPVEVGEVFGTEDGEYKCIGHREDGMPICEKL